MPLDEAVLKLLAAEAPSVTVTSNGGGFARTARVDVHNQDGPTTSYFLKTGDGQEAEIMFAGEHASLQALNNAVPGIAPRSLGHGKFLGSRQSFLLTQWLDISDRGSSRGSLASKLASLHTMPAPVPEGYDRPQFGFPVKTCCGSTPQRNDYTESWSEFYAEHRLRFILEQSRQFNGADRELEQAIDRTCNEVVPRLLDVSHLNHGQGITPVVVHGDLWSGNAASGKLPGMTAPGEIVYDSAACYAHSEYELGIMKMFGGFGSAFLSEYHQLCPKTEPVAEYDDRVALYELYHHLNHYAMFGSSYRSGALAIMYKLLKKYGSKET